MHNFYLYEPMHEAGMQVLRAAGQVRLASDVAEERIIAEIQDIDGVVVRSRGSMSRRIMQSAPRLKVVGRHGVGVDNIDVQAATELGIQVVYTPEAAVEGVAEHTLGMMLDLSKRITLTDGYIRAGQFDKRYGIEGREMRGRTLGVIGLGRIGRRVARMCHAALEMPVLYADVIAAPDLEKELGARRVDLDELLSSAEYITVHVPLLPETRKLIGEREFALMKPSAMFFSLARGAVVDEKALYRALSEKRIAGAGIDVYEQEPTPADNPLLQLDNVVLTPHIASATEEALRNMSLVAEDLVAVLEGRAPKYPVNRLR
jgi:D-3-phosphoglycerate dehydrogenase